MLKFTTSQDSMLEVLAERKFRESVKVALIEARGDFARALSETYEPLSPAERGEEEIDEESEEPDLLSPEILGREPDGLDRFIDDILHTADQMELYDEQSAAAFLALMFEYERIGTEPDAPEIYDFVKLALEREQTRAPSRIAIIKERLSVLSEVNAVAPGVLNMIVKLEQVVEE